MNKLGKEADHTKNKVVGEVKEAAGKSTGSEKMESKGRVQSSKADLNKKMNAADKMDDKKENNAKHKN